MYPKRNIMYLQYGWLKKQHIYVLKVRISTGINIAHSSLITSFFFKCTQKEILHIRNLSKLLISITNWSLTELTGAESSWLPPSVQSWHAKTNSSGMRRQTKIVVSLFPLWKGCSRNCKISLCFLGTKLYGGNGRESKGQETEEPQVQGLGVET